MHNSVFKKVMPQASKGDCKPFESLPYLKKILQSFENLKKNGQHYLIGKKLWL